MPHRRGHRRRAGKRLGADASVKKRQRRVKRSIGKSHPGAAGRTILGPSNPGHNIRWETWEVECPSRGEQYTNNDPGSFQQHVMIVAKDCPDWRGSASSHEKGGKVGGRRMARGGRAKPIRKMGHGGSCGCAECKSGGQLRNKRKFARGNTVQQMPSPLPTKLPPGIGGNAINMKCQHYTSQFDCQADMGCMWNFSESSCH